MVATALGANVTAGPAAAFTGESMTSTIDVAAVPKPIPWPFRLLIIVSSVLLVVALFVPIWSVTLYSNQYPDGLNVNVRAGGFDAGDRGNDLTEINTLNHYIGMKPLNPSDIPELRWIGVVIGAFVVLTIGVGLLGRISGVLGVLVLFAAFGGVSFWRFYARLYEYGHTLDPRAAVKVPPFTPPVFGTAQLANFTVESYPEPGTYAMLAFALILVVAVALAARAAHADASHPA